jgi:hypothetical protein
MVGWPDRRVAASCLVLLLASSMVACAGIPADAAENPRPGRADRSGTVAPGPQGEVSVDAVRAAVLADAAQLWGRTDGAGLQVSVDAVTWGDGSLGCPAPGRMYTQALVPGWRFVVRDGERELLYHASRRGHWVQCPKGRAARPLPGDATR